MRILLALLLLAASACAETSPLFAQVDEMLASLSKITGWKVKRNIPSEILSREKFNKLLQEGVAEAEKDQEARTAELTLKMFGLIPWDFQLVRETASLLEEQAAAFYDYKKKRLFVLESTPDGSEQRLALAHELAHALADQQFGIHKYLKGARDDDALTARQSVVEGQASWLSWAYMAGRAGGTAEVPRLLIEQLSRVGVTGEDFPVLTRAPLYIRESLTFPYTEGMRFQDAIYRKLGSAAFGRVFRDPPLSSQEILHPEAYGDSVIPTHPDLPKGIPRPGRSLKLLSYGDVGEIDYSVLLRQYVDDSEARTAAAHWRGARYRLYEDKKTKAPLLIHVSEWDSPSAAREFFRLYQGVLMAKWQKFEIYSSTETALAGSGDTGDFSLRINGPYVESMEGLPPEAPPRGSASGKVQ